MSTRARVLVLVAVSALIVGAALVPVVRELHERATTICTLIGGISSLIIEVDPGVRSRMTAMKAELRQGGHTRTVTFPTARTTEHSEPIQNGVFSFGERYRVVLREDGGAAALPGPWKGDKSARVEVEAVDGDETVVGRGSETFDFDVSYPNGKGCDPEVLTHDISVDPT